MASLITHGRPRSSLLRADNTSSLSPNSQHEVRASEVRVATTRRGRGGVRNAQTRYATAPRRHRPTLRAPGSRPVGPGWRPVSIGCPFRGHPHRGVRNRPVSSQRGRLTPTTGTVSMVSSSMCVELRTSTSSRTHLPRTPPLEPSRDHLLAGGAQLLSFKPSASPSAIGRFDRNCTGDGLKE
jgi:hypothetical protein